MNIWSSSVTSKRKGVDEGRGKATTVPVEESAIADDEVGDGKSNITFETLGLSQLILERIKNQIGNYNL